MAGNRLRAAQSRLIGDLHHRWGVSTPLLVNPGAPEDEYLGWRVPRGRDFLRPVKGQDFLSANLGRGTRRLLPENCGGP